MPPKRQPRAPPAPRKPRSAEQRALEEQRRVVDLTGDDDNSEADIPMVAVRKRRASAVEGERKRRAPTNTVSPSESASASSSSSAAALVAASPVVAAQKYYFVQWLGRSFTKDELWALWDHVEPQLPPIKYDVFTECTVSLPSGERVVWPPSRVPDAERLLEDRAHGWFPPGLWSNVIDWARTTAQTECPLSADAYERPHLLVSTGRSYSLDAWQRCVESTLVQGEPLRLEDGTVLTVFDLQTIKLLPNYSLPGWPVRECTAVRYDNAAVVVDKVRFNRERMTRLHHSALSAAFDRLSPDPDGPNSCVDGALVCAEYARVRGLADASDVRVVENFRVSDAVFPRLHPKRFPSMRNIEFSGCVLPLNCWCGLNFIGCRFVDCAFVLPMRGEAADIKMRHCEFQDCVFWLPESFVSTPHYRGKDAHPLWEGLLRARCDNRFRSCVTDRYRLLLVNPWARSLTAPAARKMLANCAAASQRVALVADPVPL